MDEQVPGQPQGGLGFNQFMQALLKMGVGGAKPPGAPQIPQGMPGTGPTGGPPQINPVTPGMGGAAPMSQPPIAPNIPPRQAMGPGMRTGPYANKADRSEAMTSSILQGLGGFISQSKERKEAHTKAQAENYMIQFVNAQQALAQNPQDKGAQAVIDMFKTDTKIQKTLEKGLDFIFPKEPGEPAPPEAHGLLSGIKKVLGIGQQQQQQAAPQGGSGAMGPHGLPAGSPLMPSGPTPQQIQQMIQLQQAQGGAQLAGAQASAAHGGASPDAIASGQKSEDIARINAGASAATDKTNLQIASMESGRLTRGQPVVGPDKKQHVPWYDKQGNLSHYTDLEGIPASMMPSTRTSTQTVNEQGQTITTSTTSKGMPAARGPGANKAAPPGKTGYAQLSWLDNGVLQYAQTGKEPTGAMGRMIKARALSQGFIPGQPPTTLMRQRGSAAQTLLQPAAGGKSMIDETMDLITKNKDKLGPYKGNIALAYAKAGSMEPEIAHIYSNLSSIYGTIANMHGKFSPAAVEEFRRSYGNLNRQADSLVVDLQAAKSFAETLTKLGSGPQQFGRDPNQPQAGGAAKPKATSYKVGNDMYQGIPPDKVDAFLKSHPNAVPVGQ